MEQKIIDDKEIKIGRLETISKILLIVFCFFNTYYSINWSGWEITCLGNSINGFIFASPLITAIIIEIIAFSKREKYGLPSGNSVKSFVKFLIFSLLFFLIASTVFVTLSSNRGKAIDARTKSVLFQIRDAQIQFYKENGRYANSLEELKNTSYSPYILEEAEKSQIIFESSKDSDTWRAHAFIKAYLHEICGGIKEPKYIYVCDKNECEEAKTTNY